MNSVYSTNLSIVARRIPTLSLAIAVATLAACGGSGQDRGSANVNQTQTYSGLAIDGHLARAKVFIDSDNNGTRDAWEPFAFTDNQGYYSYNPKSQKDYCASSATAEEAQYCLKVARKYDNAVVRIDGGYDALTGEPFASQLSRRLSTVAAGTNNAGVISPLTSLTASLNDADTAKLLAKLNITKNDLDSDYADKSATAVNAKLFNLALKVHKSVTLLSDKVGDNYPALGDEPGTPNDASARIYEHLAKELNSTTSSVDQALEDKTLLKRVIRNTEENIKTLYTNKEINLPANAGDDSKFDRVIETAANIPAITNELIPADKTITLNEAQGSARALEVLVIKGTKETTVDNTVDNVVNFYRNGNSTEINNLVASLAGDKADVSHLAENNFAAGNFASPENAAAAAQLPDTASTFTQVGGRQLKVSDLDLGQAPNNLKDIEFELYFAGSAQATSGSFNACAKYVKKAKSDGTLGKGNSRGEMVKGYWSLLGANGNQGSYSLLLTFEFLGANYQAIMKSAGTTTINGVTYQQLRFDNNDEYRIWHSAKGMEVLGTQPTTSAECQNRLPSRVGI